MLYLFWGDNNFAKQARINELVEQHIATHGEDGIERLDGEEIDVSNLQNLTAQSLFATNRIVVIKDLSLNKNITQMLTEVVKRIPDSTTVIFSEQKLKKNTQFYKLFSKEATAKEFNELNESQLVSWAVKYAGEIGAQLATADARLLVGRVGRDQLLLKNEIQKLASYDLNISKTSIELLIVQKPEDNVFELLDLIGKGRATRARRLYRELRNAQAEPHYVMSMIGWQLGNMATVVAHQGKTAQQIATDAGISPYVAQKSLGITRGLSPKTITTMLDYAAETDIQLKTSAATPDQLIEQLIDQLSLTLKQS